ncbi:MAG: 4-alpha-glucanotransferase [bacterium]|nr:4-alpha-glucanotransferase [bacterium]
MKFERSSGILLHPTSLPGKFGIGDLGEHAYRFVDLLAECRQKLWQIFPLGPTGYGDSPYQSFSAFAGNPLLISLEALVEEDWLAEADLAHEPFDAHRVDYWPVIQCKTAILAKAHRNFLNSATSEQKADFETFCEKQESWLEDYALFMALKDTHEGAVWNSWEEELVTRKPAALASWRKKLTQEISYQKFIQFLFFAQWHKLRGYANGKGLKIIGDIPIFAAFDSMDAWAHPDLFFFDEKGHPECVAGVPPDYFSATGQLWGNPLYRWDVMKEHGYTWWIERFKKSFELVDIVRVDHFRGFAKYWRVPAGETTAINGSWEPGPGEDLFRTIEDALGKLPIIAEDLGVITPDVVELRDAFDFPGMKILQFAFDSGEDNDYLPHSYDKNCVVYTGTHDNDTTKGWFEKAGEDDKHAVRSYLQSDGDDICWDFIQAAWSSVADIAMVPLQDLLGLGSEARMNTPSTLGNNWAWRFSRDMIPQEALERLKLFTKIYGR